MVFVTVGNATQSFRRLISAVDRLAGDGVFGDERVTLQSGHTTDFQAAHCEQAAFVSMDTFAQHIREASMVICHAGNGTLLHALVAGKVPIVMPRRLRYGEHIDDHQIELTEALAQEGRIVPAYEVSDLPGAIAEARRRGDSRAPSEVPALIGLVERALDRLVGGKEPSTAESRKPKAESRIE